MRVIDSAVQDALDAGRIVDRGMVLFDFPSGSYGFWTGIGPLEHNGVTYRGAGSLINVAASGIAQVMDGSAVPIVVTLSAIPNSALSPDVLTTIEEEDYKGRAVRVFKAHFDPDTRALLSVRLQWAGTVDNIDHEYTIGGGYELVVNCESRALDHRKTGYRVRSDADQRRSDPDDGFFKRAGTAASEVIAWGRKPSKASSRK